MYCRMYPFMRRKNGKGLKCSGKHRYERARKREKERETWRKGKRTRGERSR